MRAAGNSTDDRAVRAHLPVLLARRVACVAAYQPLACIQSLRRWRRWAAAAS